MKVKTRELIDAALDWAVGTALGLPVEVCQIFQYGRPNGKHYISIGETDRDGAEVDFEPSNEWAQGGPIIQSEGIELMCGLTEDMAARFKNADPHWSAFPFGRPDVRNKRYLGPTPLIAAMRCFVATQLGDEIEIPEELL